MGYIMLFGFALVFFGFTGFSKGGLPFRSRQRLAGRSARIVGGLCSLVGLGIVATTLALSDSPERTRLMFLAGGIVIGAVLTWNSMRGTPWP